MVVADPAEVTADRPPSTWRRRRRWLVVAAALAVVLAGGALGWWGYAAHYQPLRPGPFSGVHGAGMKLLTDGIEDEHVALFGPEGTTGYLVESVDNDGDVAIRIDAVPLERRRPVGPAQWVPLPDSKNCAGCVDERRPFPATVPPHGQIGIVIRVRQPRCSTDGGWERVDGFPVRFHAYGVAHVVWMPTITPEFLFCPPPEARRHVHF